MCSTPRSIRKSSRLPSMRMRSGNGPDKSCNIYSRPRNSSMRCAISRMRNYFPSACGCGPRQSNLLRRPSPIRRWRRASSRLSFLLWGASLPASMGGGRVAGRYVLALGKLGSREMTATSDLDLILIYDFDPARPESDGSRSLHVVQYYTRLAQRLISALTVATRRGRLYEVDMRLRPSGRQGPLATQFAHFVDYQTKEAETWEHMALTRARPIAGDFQLGEQVSGAIRAVLTRRRGGALHQDVYEMRRLIAQAKGDSDPWDLKLAAGGLIDIEFLAQYLLLRHAHAEPSLICVSALAVIETAATRGLLDAERARVLVKAYRLFSDVTQILRLTLDPGTDPRAANEAVKRRLAKVAGQPAIGGLESCLRAMRAEVRRLPPKAAFGAARRVTWANGRGRSFHCQPMTGCVSSRRANRRANARSRGQGPNPSCRCRAFRPIVRTAGQALPEAQAECPFRYLRHRYLERPEPSASGR